MRVTEEQSLLCTQWVMDNFQPTDDNGREAWPHMVVVGEEVLHEVQEIVRYIRGDS